MTALLSELMSRQKASQFDLERRLAARQEKALEANKKVDRLYQLVEDGLVSNTDYDFRKRFTSARSAKAEAEAELQQVAAELSPEMKLSHERVLEFIEHATAALEDRSIEKRKAVIRSLVDEIKVGEDRIAILGRTSLLEKWAMRGAVSPSAVPSFVREWRSERDYSSQTKRLKPL
ncbi:hypothetical protein [Limimaricola cinnabarinus]|uniref:hypothetical protein n=1 Tax=Limimaricola cinnabarinus TaxID=1125964 RepID=UPI0005EC900C|nr:hypothetical protein [Limimaricola cinnabarinus]